MPSGPALVKRYEALRADAQVFRTSWQEIAEYVVPHKSNITTDQTPGAKQTEALFDATAIECAGLLAASLDGTMTPSTQPWVSYRLRDDDLNDTDENREWLEDVSARVHRALRQSNFNTAVHETYLDLVAFGTGALFVDEKPLDATGQFAGFSFLAIPAGTYVIAEDVDGRVDTLGRLFKVSARAAVNQWGEGKVGQHITQLAETKPDTLVEILHIVLPRQDRAFGLEGQPKRGAKNMPFASYYVALKDKKIIEESGYEEFPFMVPRWTKSTGEVYGRGPSHTALPDVKSLNALVEFTLKALPLAMQPPTVERDDAVLGDVDLTPGGRNVVNGAGPLGDQLAFMETRFKPDLAERFFLHLQQKIESIYFKPQLQLQDGPQMTATEVQVRYELQQRFLGPTTGRLHAELLNPLTHRVFAILARARALAPLPQALAQAVQQNTADLDVEYEGPLARAQRTIEITAQDRMLGFVTAIMAIDPQAAMETLDNADLDAMYRARAKIVGLPSDQVRDVAQVQAKREERAEAQAAQLQAQQAQVIADAAMKGTGAIKNMSDAAAPRSGQRAAA